MPTAGRIVRTVRGDVDPATLGVVLGHEHLIGAPPESFREPDLVLDDPSAMADALAAFSRAARGLVDAPGTVVEMSTIDYGRDVAALAELSSRTGVHVVAATGFNRAAYSGRISGRYGVDALARWMIGEVQGGALPHAAPDEADLGGPRLAIRAGLIKAATGRDGPDAPERAAMDAAVQAHLATGAPIGTHTEKGTWVQEQAAFLVDAGARPDKLLIGHCDFLPGLDALLEVARTGARIGLDQFGKTKYLPDETRVERIAGLASEGFLDRVILAGDLARRSYHPELGGHGEAPGLAHIPRDVAPMLRAAGLAEGDVMRLLRDNPRDWLAFRPIVTL